MIRIFRINHKKLVITENFYTKLAFIYTESNKNIISDSDYSILAFCFYEFMCQFYPFAFFSYKNTNIKHFKIKKVSYIRNLKFKVY